MQQRPVVAVVRQTHGGTHSVTEAIITALQAGCDMVLRPCCATVRHTMAALNWVRCLTSWASPSLKASGYPTGSVMSVAGAFGLARPPVLGTSCCHQPIACWRSMVGVNSKNSISFPSDEVLLKLFDLALNNISTKWTMPIRDWKAALNRFPIQFEGRIPKH